MINESNRDKHYARISSFVRTMVSLFDRPHYKSHAIFPSCSLSSRVHDNDRNCTCAMADLGKSRKNTHIPECVINDRYFLIVINNALHPRSTLLILLYCDISLFTLIGLPEKIYNNIIDISRLYIYIFFFSII